jgi:hypothetical protein
MQGMPLFVCITPGGWTVASQNGRPKGPFESPGQAVSFAARAIDRLRTRGRQAWVVMEQPEIAFSDTDPPPFVPARPLAAMPGDGLCGCSGW